MWKIAIVATDGFCAATTADSEESAILKTVDALTLATVLTAKTGILHAAVTKDPEGNSLVMDGFGGVSKSPGWDAAREKGSSSFVSRENPATNSMAN